MRERVGFYKNLGEIWENVYDLCMRLIVLFYFNEISRNALIKLIVVVRIIALRAFN